MRNTARLVALSPLPLALALFVAGCSAPAAPDESSPNLATATSAITAAGTITRAEEWVTAKLLYCQSPNGADDSIDPACAAVCKRTSNPAWDPYRSDCSGLVSWAWGLPAPGRTTSDFAPNESDITSPIQASKLATGDAVNTDDSVSNEHHIMLFKAWVTAGTKATFIEEPGCSATPNYAHEFTSTVSINGTQITVDYNGFTFTAIHYKDLDSSYAAKYVSQSWPLSSDAPIQMTVGKIQKGSIDMSNIGTATWKAGVVKLAPIPRDMASDFHASTWLSPTRVSTLAADVAPGATGHFEWDLDPSEAGTFMPYFGLVADGITWFADSGGPPDNDLQVSIDVAAAAPTGAGGGGGVGGAGGSNDTSGVGGSLGQGSASGGAGGAMVTNDPSPAATSSCQMSPGTSPPSMGLGLLAGFLLARRRRVRKSQRRAHFGA